jgi:hypothetical protein
MLERIALNPDVSADKLERLLAIQERVMGKQAEDEFNIAMSAAQSEMGPVSADALNPQTHSRYATYGTLDKALRPIYIKHGFALSFDAAEAAKPDYVRMICHVSHRGGHTRTYHREMPVETTGLKGNAMATKTHASAIAESYAMRYLLKGIFNVSIGEADTDGNTNQRGPTLTDAQVADLEALMEEVGVIGERRARALKAWRVEKLEQILARDLPAIIEQLERKRQ